MLSLMRKPTQVMALVSWVRYHLPTAPHNPRHFRIAKRCDVPLDVIGGITNAGRSP
jgi:hypothetical protein